MSENEGSLKDLFASVKESNTRMETLDPRSEEFSNEQRSALNALEECRDLIARMALFSTNETIEDVSTNDLQFLSIDYLLAEMLLRSYGNNRLEQLRKAAELLESFLTRLDQYEKLSVADRKLFERYQDNRRHFTIISTNNPEDRRNQKISRFQQEKALKSQLKLLRDKTMVNNVDDEVARSLYLSELTLHAHESFQSLDMINQEITMLSQMRNQEVPSISDGAIEDVRGERRDRDTGQPYSDRLDGPVTMGGLGRKGGPLLSPSGKPLQPFTLTDKRTQLQKGVFRPGHNLPTMSIDEYLEEEKRRGGIIDGGGNANASQPEPDEDNLEQVDAATMKAREWDEFVEANPKGAGNTLNRG